MKKKVINPQEYTFCFRLGIRDCHKLRTGKCSLHYSLEEYTFIKNREKIEGIDSKECGVDYCRKLANDIDYWQFDDSNTGIFGTILSCGHISLDDGQHRTCVAKQLGIKNLTFSNLSQSDDFVCGVCHRKNLEKNMSVDKEDVFKHKNRQKKLSPFLFLDDEYLYNR
ncbi:MULTISPECIES: hypothetical protein [Bacillati]|uniref:hypothetical protein n=1 Tax=Bacillati TaxID=1783272 RepID=UPI0022B9AEAB|nr:hypothetical protein [Caldifermentibacillus hisashii]